MSSLATPNISAPAIPSTNLPIPTMPINGTSSMANVPMPMQSPQGQSMDPLAALSDIYLPEMVHQYPVAPGWWVLLFTLVGTLIFIGIKLYKYHQRCQVKKQAINTIKHNHLPDNEIVATLKWATLTYFPREKVASLYGVKFQRFLSQQLDEKYQTSFNELTAESMNNLYQGNTQHSPNLEQAALLWLTQVLPTAVIAPKGEMS